MLEKESFLREFNLEESFGLCKIEWNTLEKIYNNYCKLKPVLEKVAKELLKEMRDSQVEGIHSLRFRVKEEKHLIEKIIRNNIEGKAKYQQVDESNYYKKITDMIGVRILLLYKEDWKGFHKFITSVFEDIPKRYIDMNQNDFNYVDDWEIRCFAECPIAFLRYGDKFIYEGYIKTEYTYKDYRSIHYVLKYKNQFCEVQVRTLAEEIYGEFDHNVRYPYKKENKFLKSYTSILSKVMVATDEMISLCKGMPEDIIDKCDTVMKEEIPVPMIEKKEQKKTEVAITDLKKRANWNINRRQEDKWNA